MPDCNCDCNKTATASLRHRLNISSTSKGVLSWETTVDGVGPIEDLLAQLDIQVMALKARTQPEVTE